MTTLPPLIALAEGRKVRPRKATIARPKEVILHFAVAKILREHCHSEWQWTHIGHGEARDIRTAAKLKAMGVRRGWPDFVLVPPAGQLHCLEFKRLGEKLSEDQEAFRLWCIRHGVPFAVAHSFDEAIGTLDHWQCLRIKIAGRAMPEGGVP
jgi:hypothetical protein